MLSKLIKNTMLKPPGFYLYDKLQNLYVFSYGHLTIVLRQTEQTDVKLWTFLSKGQFTHITHMRV